MNDTVLSRRQFVGSALAVSAAGAIAGAVPARAEDPAPPARAITRKIKLGVIGCGGRGAWLADLFVRHGGYEIVGAADYFPERVNGMAGKFKLAPEQLFTGLKCHERMIEKGGVEAVAIISPPYFHPAQAAAAVAAGLHVYLAKPIAVDAPGCQTIRQSGESATQKKLVFLVDFQTRANEFYIEAMKRVHAGALGETIFGEAQYLAGRLGKHGSDQGPEGRLRNWVFDKALSGDIVVEQNIHTLDVMNWAMKNVTPVRCTGVGGRKVRVDVGDAWDHFCCTFEYPGKVGISFSSRQYDLDAPGGILNKMYGSRAALLTEYGGNVIIRGPQDVFYRGGKTGGIYEEGAVTNIGTFYDSILGGQVANPTVLPSVTSNMIAIMARMAAYDGRTVTWDEVANSKVALDGKLEGLKV